MENHGSTQRIPPQSTENPTKRTCLSNRSERVFFDYLWLTDSKKQKFKKKKMEGIRALLDQLMGPNRNGDRKPKEIVVCFWLLSDISRISKIVVFANRICLDSVCMMCWRLQSMISVLVANITIRSSSRRTLCVLICINSFERDPDRDKYGYESILLADLKEQVRQCDRRINVAFYRYIN